jgi:hypothetical protein
MHCTPRLETRGETALFFPAANPRPTAAKPSGLIGFGENLGFGLHTSHGVSVRG